MNDVGKTGRLRNGQKAIIIIRKSLNGEIHPIDLMDAMDISESGYYSLKKYLEFKFPDWVRYDKRKKTWCVVNEAYILPQKTLEQVTEIKITHESKRN